GRKDEELNCYNLGRMHNYGHKPKDTAKDKLAKADLILGRRISEATFSVYKANEPDEYLQLLINMHTEALGTENPELGIIQLIAVSGYLLLVSF
ncbi:hypothetical protein, partial [Klebsiella pneumoniae]|uniref:hypothetical protein n=1 Tax=Klebsiella pneumoniae TaxID=573 RepID=UPI003968EA39